MESVQCQLCETVFACKSHLTRHMVHHTREDNWAKPFQCNECKKRIYNQATFNRTYEDPHRRETISMQRVYKKVRPQVESHSSLNEDSHRGDTISMQRVQKKMCQQVESHIPFEDSHRRETISMQRVYKKVLTQVDSNIPFEDSHWGKTISMQCVQKTV